MGETRRRGIQALALVLFIGTILLQIQILPIKKQIGIAGFSPDESKKTELMLELPNQMLGAVAIGFKEAIAAVLWVRADEFFHTGNYDAILPITRMVTWLDPHQLDVYSTGAWHLDYNFTDSESRSDRRYIPPAIALLREGIKNNPKIYDLYFELGWTHYYQKIKDYKSAAYWIEKAANLPGRDPNTGKIGERPAFVEHMLAHALEQTGDYAKSEAVWNGLIARYEKKLKDKNGNTFEANMEISVCKKNLSTMLLRQGFRYGNMDCYRRGLEVGESLKNADETMKKALANSRAQYERMMAQGVRPGDVYPPIDVNFEATVKREAPRVLLVEGTANLVPAKLYDNLAVNAYTSPSFNEWRDGWASFARVYVVLTDADYVPTEMKEFSWQVDPKLTIMQTDTQINKGKFSIRVDMSKDLKQYPFAKDKYKLTIYMDPRLAPEEIQDRIGWLGEGITDKKWLDTTTYPGVKMLRWVKELDREDIFGKGRAVL